MKLVAPGSFTIRVLLATEFPCACSLKLDRTTQISGLKKLKLARCASAVAWVELFAHGLGVSNEAQLVGYGAIDAAR
jgi:hypothetical protein